MGRNLMVFASLGVIGVLGLCAAQMQSLDHSTLQDRYESTFGGSFSLTATDGANVTDRSFRGKPFALFFGFTRCPDVCPTTLARLARLKRQMGSTADELQIVFVSVDPEHDTPTEIRKYLGLFGTPIVGATGSRSQVAAALERYEAVARRVALASRGYTIDHTATVFLMGRRGEFLSTIDAHEPDETALVKLRRALGKDV